MKAVSIHEAKAHFSALVARVEDRRERVVISRYGRAVAELVPMEQGSRTRPDKLLSRVKVHGDLTSPTIAEWDDA